MSFLREMGLTAVLLAATGGAVIATWSYISARRRKEAGHGSPPEQEHGEDKRNSEQPSMVTPSSPGTRGAQIGFSETQGEEQAAEAGTLVLPVHTHRTGGEHSKQEENTSQPEREHSALTVLLHHTSQPETAASACAVQLHRRSQPERSAVQGEAETEGNACAVQVDERSQPQRSAVQVKGETEGNACAVQVDERSQPQRSAVQVEAETEGNACAVQVDQRSQPEQSAVQVDEGRACAVQLVQLDQRSEPERSTVQVEGEGSASAVQVDQKVQPERSAVQVEAETAYAAQEDMRAEQLPLPLEPPILKELSDSCTEIQAQVKVSLRQHVVVLGLDGAGKTSVLNSIAANKGKFVTTPTAGVNALCVSNGTSKMEFLEIGGSEHLRPYWKMYLSKAFAVIFVVDAADHSRLPLAKRHLHQLIQQDAIIPLLVLANKQDLKNAYHITEIHEALGLSDICENRKLFLIGTYVTKEESEVSSGILDTKEFLAQLHAENSAIRS